MATSKRRVELRTGLLKHVGPFNMCKVNSWSCRATDHTGAVRKAGKQGAERKNLRLHFETDGEARKENSEVPLSAP